MKTWSDYKQNIKDNNPDIATDVEEVEEISRLVGIMIQRRHFLNLSQRDLAEQCGIPHSSIARIESGKSTPNLTTLVRIFNKLDLTLMAEPRK
jgi:predicted transcriptional regulator